MKKRKELDALLMNGKKSRPKRSKDGHELLQNMDSDTNSSDLEEFIMQPRKQTIVRRKIALCSICLRLLVFILVVTCLAATAGVVWMNIQLKNDLDELRQKMTEVESSLSKSQGSSLDEDQEEKLKMIPGLVTNIGKLNDSLISLNKSLETLKGDIPKMMTTKVNQVDTKYSAIIAETKDHLTNLGKKLEKLESSVDTLKTDVATLKEQSSQPPPGPTQTPSKVTSPTGTKTESPSDSSVALLSVRKSIQALSDSISGLNQTVIDLASEVSKQHGGSVPVVDSTELLQKLQQNVTYLMQVVQREISADNDSTESPNGPSSAGGTLPPASNMTGWQHLMENRLSALEVEINQFNPSDLNNNLLNNDTARGIQTILEGTYKVFRDEINDKIKAWESNQTELANRISEESLLLTNLKIRVDQLEFQFENSSSDKTSETPSAKDDISTGNTSEPSNGTPTERALITEQAAASTENKKTTVVPNKPPTSPGTNNGMTVESSQVSTPTPAATTNPADGASNGGVTDLENLKKTLPSSTSDRSMASRSVASLTGATALTGVEERASTKIGTTFETTEHETTEHETTTKQKLTTTPPPPPLRIPGVNGARALRKNFHNWDTNRDGKLTYWEFSRLRAFRGHPPTEDEFLAHDKDNDGSLNQHEMEVALGFSKR